MTVMQDKGLDEAFWPIFQLDEAEKDKNKVVQGGMRFGVALGILSLGYAFYQNVPDRGKSFHCNEDRLRGNSIKRGNDLRD